MRQWCSQGEGIAGGHARGSCCAAPRCRRESDALGICCAPRSCRFDELLLEAKADPAQCRTVAPLARAAANGNTRTATLLLAARANVADVQEPHGQSVLDKAIAASEAGGIACKGGEWWKIPKLLGEACGDSSTPAPLPERRRRSRRRCSDGGGERSKAAPPPMPVA